MGALPPFFPNTCEFAMKKAFGQCNRRQREILVLCVRSSTFTAYSFLQCRQPKRKQYGKQSLGKPIRHLAYHLHALKAYLLSSVA
jgi:hypothetical protein